MRRTLLVVDDVKVNRDILNKILCDEYDIIEAENGNEALEKMTGFGPELSAVLLDLSMPVMNGFEVIVHMKNDADLKQIPIIVMTAQTEEASEVKALKSGANDYIIKPYNPTIIRQRVRNVINLRETAAAVNELQIDHLTGICSRNAFFDKAAAMINEKESSYYVLSCFDIDNFKVINDQYGTLKGDSVLRMIADTLKEGMDDIGGLCGRIMADNFAIMYPRSFIGSDKLDMIREKASVLDGSIAPISFSTGRYIIDDNSLSVNSMFDKATMAEMSIKGRYDTTIAEFSESMREQLLQEQQIVTEMNSALRTGQFEPWFQPQYNHATGELIGAEALVRWRHPEHGLISPAKFIPVFEQNGFIYELDKYIWEETCRCLHRWIKEERSPLPVSVNVSRYDVYKNDLTDIFSALIEKYKIPVDLLRIEITESAFSKSSEQIISVVKSLIEKGFTVEIDDFGSGYSSLNTLKDVPAQVIKLDMKFLESSDDSKRGGNILESMVRMAKWLDMSVIAEGVETKEQADFLKSIGCFLVQGYLYAKPMPVTEYEALAAKSVKQRKKVTLETLEHLDNNAFWDPDSLDTLIFNTYLGGACIYEYENGNIELLRANDKYVQVIGSAGMTLEDALKLNWADHMDDESKKSLSTIINTTLSDGNEKTEEFVFTDLPGCPEKVYLRSTLRVIARIGERYLIYCTNENITAQRIAEQKRLAYSDQLTAIMKNLNGGISAKIWKDGKPDLLFANAKFYSMLGYTKEQFTRECPKGLFDIMHPKDISSVKAVLDQVFSTEEPTAAEFRLRTRDGRSMWIRSHNSICHINGISDPVQLSIIVDITKQKETTEQLRFLESVAHALLANPDTAESILAILRRLRDFFDSSRVYVFELDFKNGSAACTYEVCGEGIREEKNDLQDISLNSVAYWLHAFDEQDHVDIKDVKSANISDREKKLILDCGVSSLLAIPLRRNGKLIGFVGIDEPLRRREQIKSLSALGDYVSVLLNRRDLCEKIKEENL